MKTLLLANMYNILINESSTNELGLFSFMGMYIEITPACSNCEMAEIIFKIHECTYMKVIQNSIFI